LFLDFRTVCVCSYVFAMDIILRSTFRTFRSTLFIFCAGGTLIIADDLRDFWCDRSPPKVRRDEKCTRRLARVRLKNVRFYRDGPWEKFDGNDTSVRPSSRAFSLSHSLSVSVCLRLSLSIFLSRSRAYCIIIL